MSKAKPTKELPRYPSPRISSEINDCSLPLTFDSYSKCSYNCEFCFSSVQKCNTPGASRAPLQAVSPSHIETLITGNKLTPGGESYAFHNLLFKNRFIFHWGGLSDPFCNFERKFGIGYDILKVLAEHRYPTLFSTKGGSVLLEDRYLNLWDDNKQHNSFAFQFSIVTADENISKIVERGVPSPLKRFTAMKTLSDMGYWTVLRLRPYIIGVTDKSIDEILQRGLDAGMNAISTEFYAMEGRVNPQALSQYKVMQDLMHVEDIHKYYRALSPAERGTYRRLNRDVKEPYIKKLYEFCAKHNLVFACSDPDYKELSTTTCCCGLPDVNPGNPEFQNFFPDQLTRVMKEARRLYHTTGERALLTFDGTYGKEENFLDNIELSHQNYGCTAYNYAYRKQLTTRHILQSQWNILRSPANPRNYFHGKLMPVGTDENNLIFQYVPMPYEGRWAAEGIDMRR